MADPGISLHDVLKNYDAPGNSVPALAATSLDVRQGELLVLLGPSGCGKTTLLRMIGGLIKPSEGRIEVAGLPLWTANGRNQEAVRKLGIVFQDPNLFPWLTIEDNVALPLEIQGVPRNRGLRGRASCWRWSASPDLRTGVRASCPAVCGSAPRSRGRWPAIRKFCCLTSPSAPSMR